jgi:Tfp pilus assembly protein PilV
MFQGLTRLTQGGTFIEVMMACVVLPVIAIAGASFAAQSHNTLATHRNRSVALAAANSRLEEISGIPYGQLTNLVSGAAPVWIKRNGTGWQVTTASDFDLFMMESSAQELRTSLSLTNWPALGVVRLLRVTTQATYKKPDYVTLTTLTQGETCKLQIELALRSLNC